MTPAGLCPLLCRGGYANSVPGESESSQLCKASGLPWCGISPAQPWQSLDVPCLTVLEAKPVLSCCCAVSLLLPPSLGSSSVLDTLHPGNCRAGSGPRVQAESAAQPVAGTGGQRTHSQGVGTAGAPGRLWSSGDGGQRCARPGVSALQLYSRRTGTKIPSHVTSLLGGTNAWDSPFLPRPVRSQEGAQQPCLGVGGKPHVSA